MIKASNCSSSWRHVYQSSFCASCRHVDLQRSMVNPSFRKELTSEHRCGVADRIGNHAEERRSGIRTSPQGCTALITKVLVNQICNTNDPYNSFHSIENHWNLTKAGTWPHSSFPRSWSRCLYSEINSLKSSPELFRGAFEIFKATSIHSAPDRPWLEYPLQSCYSSYSFQHASLTNKLWHKQTVSPLQTASRSLQQ